MVSELPPIAITMGDPAGISGEITIKAWVEQHQISRYPFFLIDDPKRILKIANDLDFHLPIHLIDRPELANKVFKRALPILVEKLSFDVVPGSPSPSNASTVIRSIDIATNAVLSGTASAMVTNPIHKSTLYESGFSYPGHTEYLAKLTNIENTPGMMLVSKGLRVVPVTIHLSLKKAIDALSTDKIVDCINLANKALKIDFGIKNPRIAVAGLNPHAGENGHLGREEIEIITPAIDKLRLARINVNGPFPADSLFHKESRENYDLIICMYHDQALIPSKLLDFRCGVNVTLGLPIIRTSPDHGTALDIAGNGEADPRSLMEAINFAGKLAENRKKSSNGVFLA